jgi:hypothetical protein
MKRCWFLLLGGLFITAVFVAFGWTSWSAAGGDKRYKDGIVWAEPKVVTPGVHNGPPSDAIVLFDGKNFEAWKGADKWKVDADGGATAVSRIETKDKFGDCQLHVEWAEPNPPKGKDQGRGNNGIGFMGGRYEIQVLDSYENPTYFVGQCAAVYNHASRKPGEWQTYDIVFEAPRFDKPGKEGKLLRPGYVTVFHNGICVQNHTEIKGSTHYDKEYKYDPHADKLPLVLLYHNDPVRFRNIWVRELKELEKTMPK